MISFVISKTGRHNTGEENRVYALSPCPRNIKVFWLHIYYQKTNISKKDFVITCVLQPPARSTWTPKASSYAVCSCAVTPVSPIRRTEMSNTEGRALRKGFLCYLVTSGDTHTGVWFILNARSQDWSDMPSTYTISTE